MPFRERRPTYQREWRILRSLREIRDAIAPVLRAIEAPLDKLISRAETVLAARAQGDPGPQVRGRNGFADIVAVARRLSVLTRELAALSHRLDSPVDSPGR